MPPQATTSPDSETPGGRTGGAQPKSLDTIGLKIVVDLVHRYAGYVRGGEGAACAELFAEDATYEIMEVDASSPGNRSRLRRELAGRAAIRDFLVATSQSGVRLCPLIHNLVVRIDGDEASGVCMMESRTWPAGHETIGEYRDSFRKIGGLWFFQSRRFTVFLPAEAA